MSIQKEVLNIMSHYKCDENSNLVEELDSLDFVKFIIELEEVFDIVIDEIDLDYDNFADYSKICKYILEKSI